MSDMGRSLDGAVRVVGTGALADRIRASVSSDASAAVVIAGVDGSVGAVAIGELTDAMIDDVFERPMQNVIAALQEAHTSGCRRIVVVVPTTGMSGGSHYAVHAALAESARILVKSAARQWGAHGITVNAVAVDPQWFAIDPAVSGPVSIAPRALVGEVDPVNTISFLCSEGAGHVTGQTLVCDGGLWM